MIRKQIEPAANTPEIIIEVGQAHDGSVGILHSLIDAIADTGARVIKFQMHIAEAESSIQDEFRVNFSKEDKTRQDYWKRMELSIQQWAEVKSHCESVNCEFLCTPFSVAAVKLLDKIGVDRFKVGSGDTSNLVLLEAIARTGKPVILSSGMSNFDELDAAAEIFFQRNLDVSIMQCTSEYPTQPSQWGLNVISELKSRYGTLVGLSDHSGTIYPGLAAAAIGADLIEVHATFDRRMFGPDASSSLELSEIKMLVDGTQKIGQALKSPISKVETSHFDRMRRLFGRSLTVSRDIEAGSALTFNDLETTKPAGLGIPPCEFQKVISRKLKRSLNKGNFILEDNLE